MVNLQVSLTCTCPHELFYSPYSFSILLLIYNIELEENWQNLSITCELFTFYLVVLHPFDIKYQMNIKILCFSFFLTLSTSSRIKKASRMKHERSSGIKDDQFSSFLELKSTTDTDLCSSTHYLQLSNIKISKFRIACKSMLWLCYCSCNIHPDSAMDESSKTVKHYLPFALYSR